MEMIQLNQRVWVFHNPVNVSLVHTEAGLVLVDTGMDRQAGKQMLKAIQELNLTDPLCAIINTHAHADHYGGNAYILSQHQVPVYAPEKEALLMQNPRLEPEYLWYGAQPLPELLNKFLLAPSSPVDVAITPGDALTIGNTVFQSYSLPGHAHGQIGIYAEGVFFAADAYFAANIVDKHGIPFLVNYEDTLASARKVREMQADWFVPGHGRPSTSCDSDILHLITRHERIMNSLLSLIDRPHAMDELVQKLCAELELKPPNIGAYVLLRTSVAAYVTAGVEQGIIEYGIDNGMLVVKRK